MTDDYLPPQATIAEACAWLKAHVGGTWTLARLIEYGFTPWFRLDYSPLDYSPGLPDIVFGGRVEGYLAPIPFAGDLERLATDGREALVNFTRTYNGELIKIGPPGLRMSIDELRFLRKDIEQFVASRRAANDCAENARAASAFPPQAVNKVKKNELINRYRPQWRSIEHDINENSRNGLDVAKLGGGFYDEEKALQWARNNGKIRQPIATGARSILDLPASIVHRPK